MKSLFHKRFVFILQKMQRAKSQKPKRKIRRRALCCQPIFEFLKDWNSTFRCRWKSVSPPIRQPHIKNPNGRTRAAFSRFIQKILPINSQLATRNKTSTHYFQQTMMSKSTSGINSKNDKSTTMFAATSFRSMIVMGFMLLISVAPCSSRAVHSPLAFHRGTAGTLPEQALTVALSLQGGAKFTPKKVTASKSSAVSKQAVGGTVSPARVKNAVIVIGTGLTSYLLWVYRTSWMGLFDKEKLLEKTLKALHHLDEQPKHISYSLYILGMALWEALGLSTIPVETASGMVFGWTGFYLSAIGKLAGAVVAFCLARYGILAAFIQEKLSQNQVLKLLEDSAASHPLRVSFLIKLSCFPETLKNYGSSLLHPIHLWMFAFATIVHGGTFSALWTYLGVDTAMRLKDPSIPIDGKLQILLTMAIVNGVVISPLAMAFGLKSLKKQPSQETVESGKRKGALRRLKI